MTNDETGPLEGLRVLDISHQYSGALAANMLGDMGADVLAVEHPKGSPIRTMLPKKDGASLWWKVIQRDKRLVTLDISKAKGRDVLKQLVANRDILIENFRPGTMEKWGLGPEDLDVVNPRLTMVRISGFGQDGPYSQRPGYGTVAEALSGFAHLNGFPDRPPALPSVTLADGVTAIFAVAGALAGVHTQQQAIDPRLQVVDASLLESLVRIIPNQVTALQQLDIVLNRLGNSLIDKGVLRDLYESRDGRYFTIGGGIGEHSMAKTLAGVEAPELRDELLTGILKRPDTEVSAFLNRANEHIHAWAGRQDYSDIDRKLAAADVVYGPIYTAEDLVSDPHVRSRGVTIEVQDEEWGEVLMPAPVPRFPGRSHRPQLAGGRQGRDNKEVYVRELGMTEDEFTTLLNEGVV
jgi:crotonobetainyl-CoA:carnitine CoA-transferase CaiB-like acyl-CoA transferase